MMAAKPQSIFFSAAPTLGHGGETSPPAAPEAALGTTAQHGDQEEPCATPQRTVTATARAALPCSQQIY